MSDCQPTITGVDPEHFDADKAAETLRKAMKGLGTDEVQIIKVFTEHNNAQRQEIKTRYKAMFGKDLVENLQSELSGYFEKLILYLLMPSEKFDAFCLRKAMEGVGTREIYLIDILASRSNEQIKMAAAEYKSTFGRNLEEDIVDETSGDFKRVLVSLLQAGRDESSVVDEEQVMRDTEELFDAGEGQIGTDEGVFNKIIAVRSRCHLQKVFEAYNRKSEKDFDEIIKSEFSGNTRKVLQGIVQYMKNPLVYFAKCLHDSMAGPGTDDERLMQLMVSRCEVDLKSIADTYKETYKRSLAKDIDGDTSGDYRKLLLRMLDQSDHQYWKKKGGVKD